MPAPDAKKKLASFGKNRKPTRITTTYDQEGNWVTTQHQDKMRQIENAIFNKYYGELQNLGSVEEDRQARLHDQSSAARRSAADLWGYEMSLFRQPLPTTFWINDSDPLAPEVRGYMESLSTSMVEPIPWYPIPGMAWRILADKTEFRKRPEMQALRQFLIRQTALGTISRQEEVSMIPPFLLDIQPTDKCLDMCASPGSKTGQMLVTLGRQKMVPAEASALPFPFNYESDGLVMANEIDTKRANMLVHQVKRMRLLFPFALFTNHDARYFPDIMLSSTEDAGTAVTEAMRFDKILCDVVCSGDGTLRKAPHVFKVWTPKEGMSLQLTQIQIAMRACHLLRVGGRLVYSTCSLNPIENEAVVAQIVHRTKGAMKLIDARPLLPNLPCAAGMSTWTVTDFRGNIVDRPGAIHEACFPPHTPGGYRSPAVDALNLGLCMRLFPSHCKGGGFFVAVLDKVEEFRLTKKELPEGGHSAVEGMAEPTSSDTSAQTTSTGKRARETPAKHGSPSTSTSDAPPDKKVKGISPQFVAAPQSMVNLIKSFYDIPQFPDEYLVVRTAHGERELRLTPSSVVTMVSKSTRQILAQKTDSLLVVSAGLRIFAFETLDKGWRITNESALLFAKMMAKSSRMLTVPVEFVQSMITLGGKLKEMPIENIEDAELRGEVELMGLGTVLLRIEAPAAVGGVFYSVALRARSRLQLQVDHEDIVGLQLRLGVVPVEALPAAEPEEQVAEETSA